MAAKSPAPTKQTPDAPMSEFTVGGPTNLAIPNPRERRTIYKYQLFDFNVLGADRVTLPIVSPSTPIHVAMVSRVITAWFEIEMPENGMPHGIDVEFAVVGTGLDVPRSAVHIGTVLGELGYVWHIYMRDGKA